MTIVAEVLRDDNYEYWRNCLTSYLVAQDVWDSVIATEPPEREDEPPNREDLENWRRKNAAALHAIQISCSPKMVSQLSRKSAKRARDSLAEKHGKKNRETRTEDDVNASFRHLVRAIYRGESDYVRIFIRTNQDVHNARINSYGDTALHVAINAGQNEIAKEFVQLMSPQGLKIENNRAETAIYRAAVCGNVEIAKCIISKDNSTVCIGHGDCILPVVGACAAGQTEMARYLYSVTSSDSLWGNIGASLIARATELKLFDVALDVLRKYPFHATNITREGYIPLTRLAGYPLLFPSSNRLILWKRIIYHCIRMKLPHSSDHHRIHIPREEESDTSLFRRVIGQILRMSSILWKLLGAKELYDMKLNQLYAIEILKSMCQDINPSYNSLVSEAFFEAVKHGIVEFVVVLCKVNPLLLDDVDKNGSTFLFLATRLRHENIFNLIYGLKNMNPIISHKDEVGNSLLHVAAMLAPSSQIAHISGAALKMQRELQWYKEVESLVPPSFQICYNDEHELPYEVFIKEHEALMEQGEAWMKQNASSCSIVAGLLVTVMFAVAFTVPGGNDQSTGYPIFLHKTPFKVFAIADVVSLFASTSSVLMFLGILTSRYRAEDFLKSLPTKLIIGLSTLFISIAAMVVAFCAALIIMFEGQLNIIIPIVVLAGFPIGFFVWLQFPLLIEVSMSTYGPSIFKRKMKPWL